MPKNPSKKRSEAAKPKALRSDTGEASSAVFPWLLILLFGSGCAALIYEIIWFQLLQLVIGCSAVSLGLLLAVYMGGLCIGSAALPRLISVRKHPIIVYALLELGIGLFGIVTLYAVPWLGRIYVASLASGMAGLMLRGAIAAVCLLPPTLLMGGSFPAIGRWMRTTPKGVSRLGLLYSANIAGAAIGCVLAGFHLLRVYDMAIGTYAAAALNGTIAVIGLILATRFKYEPGIVAEDLANPADRVQRSPGAVLVYLSIVFSGLTALGAEVVWTRLLSLLLGATIYTFSIILAVFLLGLWAGSSAGSFLVRRVREPRLALAVCQALLAAAIAAAAYTLSHSLPFWPVDPWLSTNPWFNFDLDVMRCLRTIFPATLLWGASFPLALAGAAAEGEDPARLSGEIYAVNTAGSIVGALAFSLILIPAFGTRVSHQLLIWLAAAAAALALAAIGLPAHGRKHAMHLRAGVALALAFPGVAVLAFGSTLTVTDIPWQVMAYGRRVAPILRGLDIAEDSRPTKPLFVGEGISASVVIAERGEQRFFYVSGKSEASSGILDMRLQRMMGHIPALVHPGPRSVLIVGFGAGVTAGSFVPYTEVQNIVVCELEPIIPPASDKFFSKENNGVLHDPRTRMVYDDARHYIYTSKDKFDVITTDPIHPWVKGTSTLYSKEYFELIKNHLNPGGVAAQWLPLYESDDETVRTELATFFEVFPKGTVWSNYLNGNGYDLVLLGRLEESPINIDELQQRLNKTGYSGVAASLAEAGFDSAVDLLATYAGRASDLRPMLVNAPVNTDLNMRLQYIAGLGLNSVTSPLVYRELISYRKFPEGLLTGDGEKMDALQELIGRPYRTF